MKQENPLVSIVICTLNGGNRITACLESLGDQTYPRNRFEVIVVDDGSKDNTVAIAEAWGARVVSHGFNRGLAPSRNSGLNVARGEIITYIDDDCVADPQWLERLLAPLNNPEIAATGGLIKAYKTEHLAERYLYAAEYGNPVPIGFGKSMNSLWRFWIYIRLMFFPMSMAIQPVEVQAVFTANAAYRISALHAIGGFDERLVYFEDTDLATRLRQAGARMLFVPSAIVYHRNPEHLGDFIVKTYRRSQGIPAYYAKEGKSLPIFPLPFFYLALSAILLIAQPLVGLYFVLLGPIALYSWWLVRAVRERNIEYLLYAYIQMILESVAVLGMVKGKSHTLKVLTWLRSLNL